MEHINLTDEELALVTARRLSQAKEDAAETFRLKALKVAYEFSEWSAKEGYGLTFSTFVNSFSYQDDDAQKMYTVVKRILNASYAR